MADEFGFQSKWPELLQKKRLFSHMSFTVRGNAGSIMRATQIGSDLFFSQDSASTLTRATQLGFELFKTTADTPTETIGGQLGFEVWRTVASASYAPTGPYSTLPLYPDLPGLLFPIRRTVLWNVDAQTAVSGGRTRFQLFPFPVHRWELSYSVLRETGSYTEFVTLFSFFLARYGMTGLFQFNDPRDYSVTAQSFGTGDGVTTQFQLERTYGGFTEPVYIITTAQIFIDGFGTAAFAISSTGVVTFTVAPPGGSALTWTGTFNWPCRFDEDSFDFEEFMNDLWELKSIKFSSEPLIA